MDLSSKCVKDAASRIAKHVKKTPVLTSSSINRLCDPTGSRKLFFKCENFQKGGAFKARGACNAVLQLSDEAASKGVITHSSGNHAQALAIAANARGVPATIIMPKNSPKVKQAAVAGYGAKIVLVDAKDRDSKCAEVAQETGAAFVHPSNDPNVIYGQGTLALEFLEQVKEEYGEDLDLVVVPVGGGGMIGGIAIALSDQPNLRVVGAEPELADDAFRSKLSGSLQGHKDGIPNTVADGLRSTLGSNTFEVIDKLVDDIITVPEVGIVSAMKLVMERMKILIEPSAGVGIGAVLSETFNEKYPVEKFKNVGVVICGGNLDLDALSSLLSILPSDTQ